MRANAFRRAIAPLLCLVSLGGCVTPLANFTAYSNPYFPKDDFERLLTAWKSGQNVSWEVRFKGSDFSSQQLLISSTGECSLGARLPGTGPVGDKEPLAFTATKAELKRVVDRLIASGVFALYDGHYGAYSQAGGAGGPDLEVHVGNLLKHVSRDEQLSTSVSPEAQVIEDASSAVVDLAVKHIK